ncbi:GAF domain-containing SpoIIE family protein phosphatase [Kitasatospora cineracea]|uniref:GAF domain-containing SpoIIE family protein phosphatase n=1 Tax=Kitasatospora cineracea TaxID=88074 RepID=UPI003404A237
MAEDLRALARAKDRLQGLLSAVLAIGGDLELPVVLQRIVTTAMDLVGARYGALGVLDSSGDHLEQFVTAGLTEQERAALGGIDFPRGRGVLGHLIHHPEPLRVDDIASHPASVGFPPGHPPMRTLLGVAVTVRGAIYGDLYLAERRDGRPFDEDDEAIVRALAGAAGLAIDNARLFGFMRDSAEQFQRLLLPALPDLTPLSAAALYRAAALPGLAPFSAAALYRAAALPAAVGGDWYDALTLPDHTCAAVIGDVAGHDLHAAAAMAQARNMLRALLYQQPAPPGSVLTRLDHTLHALTDLPLTTACLARIEPADPGWTLRWSSAGHLPPLLLAPDGRPRYLHGEPGLPLGVDPDAHRPDHIAPLPDGATVLLFSDGLVEHPGHPIDERLDALAHLASAHAHLLLDDLVHALADHHPSDGHDDMALLAIRTPTAAGDHRPSERTRPDTPGKGLPQPVRQL